MVIIGKEDNMKEMTTYENNQYEIDYEILAPGVYVYKNAIPKEWNLVDRVNNALSLDGTRFQWKQAGLGYGVKDLQHRKCQDFKIDENILSPRDEYSSDMIDLWNDIMKSIKVSLSHYKPKNYLGKIDYFECINIVRYGEGEFFKVHTDDGDPYRCTVSVVGYPNDDYEGGELWFPLFNLKYKPAAGDLVLFPSAYVYAHSSEPVIGDGIKYSLVTMTDRNAFAHRNDSPVHNPEELRRQYNV
jgi:hypothetical protein